MTDWNAETAEWYAANYGDYPTNRLALEYINLPDQSTIVDVGCGTGSALRHASSIVKDGTLIGVDPIPRMIEIAKELTKKHDLEDQIELQVGPAEAIPVQDSTADLVFAFDSIDHWNDLHQGLKEIIRILKPEGKFIIVKDLSVPGSKRALNTLEQELETAHFHLSNKEEIKTDEISFVLWTCIANS